MAGSAQQPDALPGVRRHALSADSLLPPSFNNAGLIWLRDDPVRVAQRWEAAVRRRVDARAVQRWSALRLGDSTALALLLPRQRQMDELLEPQVEAQQAQRGIAVLGQYADLGIQMNALIDLRFERLKNLRCTAGDLTSFAVGCREGFTPPRIDPQFSVRSGGVVGQRVHLNVDYDTQREFEASNNIQVYYEGLADEILRRVEVGNVSFAAPQSRFITGGIPSNNFGLALQGQLGALNFGAIYAQQKGNVVRERVFTVGDQTLQPVDRLIADRDFEPQRFFFVRNPRALPGYPALDVLELLGVGVPDSLQVSQVRIYRYRASINRPTAETNLGGIPAVALRTDSPQRAGPLNWEVLIEGRDYYLDPSGLWFALTQRVDQEDYLAVSYITAAGDTVGTFPAGAIAGVSDTLELIHAPRSGPDVPTFFYEMRNVYRLGSLDDITRTSVSVALLVGGSQRPATGAPTFLSLLGLAQETDASAFDQYNRLFPRSRDPNSGSPLREYYVIFPSLTPFADSTRLPPEYRTDSLYRTPAYLLRSQGPSPLFEIGLHYDAKGGDGRGTLALGGFQIRPGSERVTAGGRTLTRNSEYTVNYETGSLTFMNPDSLFRQPTQVAVQFEENAAFAVAPTNIIGLQARYDLGQHGSISALAISQRQRTTFTRPPLGFEPASNLVAGITGNFRFAPLRLTRLLDALPLISTEAPSAISLDAEIATSRPSPNQAGVAYVETFEDESGLFLPLSENSWEFGSRPSSSRGVTSFGIDPAGFFDDDAVLLTWQNIIPAQSNEPVQLRAQDIDPTIEVRGTGQQFESVLWMTLKPDTVGGILNRRTFRSRWTLPHTPGPRWRTITQPLSASGLDLSRIEFLEFWVLEDTGRTARNAGLTLALDFGSVHEDAVDFQPVQFNVASDTIFSGRRRAGEGRIDTERDTLTGVFNAALDDTGILGDVADSILNADNGTMVRDLPLCRSALADSLQFYVWGSELQHCTRRNGQLDTEDLNNDQHLDTLIASTGESHFRYVVPIGDPRYEVRVGGTVNGVGRWHLYRVPFRADTTQVGTPDIRQIRALRLTVIAPDNARPESTVFFAVSRMRLVGAPWVKRAGSPIAGLSGNRGELHGEVVASVVSTENVSDLGYSPPPGVVDQASNIDPGVGVTQVNERSLRLLGVDVRPGERAEAFFRFPEGYRNFLGYRQLRVWARGRGDGWDTRELRMFIKVGQDENNFYLYRTPVQTAVWTPEVVVDFGMWNTLRAQVERAFLQGQPPSGAAQCGGDTLAYVACSGPYVVHVRHPSIAPPNLTRVQELAVGFVRDSGSSLDTAELWIDDIRLTEVVNTPGYAGAINLAIAAGDVADIIFGATRRDGDFRQLGENPSYVGTSQMAFSSTIRLERFGLERLGLSMPLTIRSDRTSQDPYYINGTDVLAEGIGDVRRPVVTSTLYSLNIRRTRRGERWWERAFIDNLALSGSWSNGRTVSPLSQSGSRLADIRASYQAAPGEVAFRYLPGFLRTLLEGLPAELRNSDMVRGLREGRLRLTPTNVSFQSGLTRTSTRSASFRVPIFSPIDQADPVFATTAVFRNAANVDMRPFGSLAAGATLSWDRDLRDYGDSTVVGRLASSSRQSLLGLDVGFVRQRQLNTRLSWSPPVASWLRPRIGWNSTFVLSRDPTAGREEREFGDSAGAFRLPTTFGTNTTLDLNASLDLSRMLRGPFRDSSVVRSILNRVTQLTLTHRLEERSQFDRPGFDPGLGFQLGFGDPLTQAGRPANAAADVTLDRVAFGVRAPLGLTITGAYSERDATSYFLRSGATFQQQAREREWPNLNGRLLWTPRGSLVSKLITSVTASAGYIERSSTSHIGAGEGVPGAGLQSSQSSRSVPLSFGLVWMTRVNTTITVSRDQTLSSRSGSASHADRNSTSADLSFSFRTPREIVPLPGDVRTSLRWQRAVNHSCLERPGLPDCLVIADSRRNEYNLTMDTDLPPSVTAGLSAAYVLNDDRHLNRKFAQFTLTVSARFFFNAGEIR